MVYLDLLFFFCCPFLDLKLISAHLLSQSQNVVNHKKFLEKVVNIVIGGSKGGRQGRAPPPGGSKFFHFHAVFGKNVKNNSNFGSWRPPPGKILDPPLIVLRTKNVFYRLKKCHNKYAHIRTRVTFCFIYFPESLGF